MQVEMMLTVTCEECKTKFVPDWIREGPADRDDETDGGRLMWVRFVPRCPSCNVVVDLLRRANLNGLANRVNAEDGR